MVYTTYINIKEDKTMPTYDEWKYINEARANYIDKRNRENEEIETLTPEQHEALQYVCSVRHELHVGHKAMFNTNSDDYRKLWDYLTEGESSSINTILESAGLKRIDGINLDIAECPSDDDWYYFMDEEEKAEYDSIDDWYEEAYNELSEILEEVNRKIENYLREIDKEHGTNYCPSGFQRILI